MQILLENNTTHFKRYYDKVEWDLNKMYIKTELDVSDLEDGEYTLYFLNNSNEIIAKELVRIGDYTNEYKTTTKKFIQYGRK